MTRVFGERPTAGHPGPLVTRYQRWGKRLLDMTLAAPAAVIASPVAIAIAVAIRIEDGPPVLFRQERVGRDGKAFKLLKFRSMPVNTPPVPSAEATALRTTRVGSLIRRLSLDELPQLMNVLRGEMSLVGPRPPLAAQFALVELRRNNNSLSLKPGLTGLAQVKSYDGMPEAEKASWDGMYAIRVSLTLDVRLLAETVTYLLKRPPQY